MKELLLLDFLKLLLLCYYYYFHGLRTGDPYEDSSGEDEVGHFDDVGGRCHPPFSLLSSCVVQHHDVIYVYDDEE